MATQSDTTSRVFNVDKEELARPSVSSLFKNQGIYNALIGVFLLYGIYFSQSLEIVTIFVFICAWCSDLRFSDSRQEDYSKARWACYFDSAEYVAFEIRKPAS